MQILPLKFIHEIDKKVVGTNLFNLAKLNSFGLPVVESVIVLPPREPVKKIIDKYSRHSNLADNKNNLKQEILRFKIPEGLLDIHLNYSDEKSKLGINIEKLWKNLLEKWAMELISKIERQDINYFNLTPQQVVLSSNFPTFGSAFFDETQNLVEIQVDLGKIDFKLSQELENIVKLGDKKLVIPQVYYWVFDNGQIKVIKLLPFTQPTVSREKVNTPPSVAVKKNLPKTATKIILDFKDEVLSNLNTDSVLINISKPGTEDINLQLSKILKFGDSKIIFYPDFEDFPGKFLEFARGFLFFRNKKNLNCQLVMPETFSLEAFLNLKREYASLGIYSKGSLKIWKQFSSVADFLNVEQYLDAGFDGALINLDKIVGVVTGIMPEVFLTEPRKDLISAVEDFFKQLGFKKLIKYQKPIIILGKTIASEELLNYFIKSGVWGIASKANTIEALREHVSFLEKTIAKTKHLN